MVWLAIYTGHYERRVNIRRIKPFNWRTIECISYCSTRRYLQYLTRCVTDSDLGWVLFFLLRRRGVVFRQLSFQVVLRYIKFQMRRTLPINYKNIKKELAIEDKGRVWSYGNKKPISYVSAQYTPIDIDIYTTALQHINSMDMAYPHLIYCYVGRFFCTIGCPRIFKFLLKTALPRSDSLSFIYAHWGTPSVILNIIENILDSRMVCSTPLNWMADRNAVEIRSYRRYLM